MSTRYPASAEQRRALAQMRIRESRAEEITRAFWIDGEPATADLVAALTAVAERRDMLRARLVVVGETVVQEIYDQPGDIEIVAVQRRADVVAAMAAATADSLTDREIWFQAVVLPSADGHGVLLRLHHSLVDGYSIGLVEEDLWAAIEGRLDDRTAPRFGPWVTARESSAAGESWWHDLLRDGTPASVEPDVSGAETLSVGAVPLSLPGETVRKIRALAREFRTTPLTVLLTAHLMTIATFSGQDDVIAATPYLNRDVPGVGDLVGPLVNLLPVRAEVTGVRLRDNLPAVAARMRAVMAHAEIPYDRIMAGSPPSLDGGFGIARTAIVLNGAGRPPVFPSGHLRISAIELPAAGLRWDLVVTLRDNGGELNGALLYRADRYTVATARSVRDRFLATVTDTHIIAMATPIPARSESTAFDLDRLLELGTFTDDRPVAQTRTAVAGRREFDRLVRGYQQVVQSFGDRPRIGLCLGATAEQAAALLAVWRCGGAAVLLDPAHPVQRRELIAEDAGVATVLTGPSGVPDARTVTTSYRDEDLAYLVYTSGTDGAPKGVGATYRNVAHLLGMLAGLRMPGAGQNPLGPAFDGWLWATLLPWVTGHPVVFPDLGRLAAVPGSVTLTPTMLAGLDPGELPESVVSAGEPLHRSLAAGRRAGRLVNAYGPTELTVCTSWADTAAGEDVTSIGKPVAGTRMYLLNRLLNPVPQGAIGEIVVAGPGVTRGYHRKPGLTARSYVADPFAGDGSRMYRTGDLARLGADGLLYYVGRRDGQTKIAGVRVELEEVAAVIAACDGVREAAALVRDGDVWAAIVPDEPGPEVAAIDHVCRERLLPEMRPTKIISVRALPATANGKLDREALSRMLAQLVCPEPGLADFNTRETVATVWKSVLGVEVDDYHKTFHELGGHSLRATMVVSRLRQEYDFPIPVRALFDNPTVEALSRWLEAQR